jgi:hypothetical protein
MHNDEPTNSRPMPSRQTEQPPVSVKAAQGLFYLIGGIWILLGVVYLVRSAGGTPSQSIGVWVISFFMLANATVLLLIGVGIGRRQKRFLYLGILVLAANILLTVTDEFGFFDLITLLIDLGLLGLLVATRSRYE